MTKEMEIPYKYHQIKPIFDDELNFLNKHLGGVVKPESWRHGQSIFLDPYQNKPYLTFNIKEGELVLKRLYEDRVGNDRLTLEEVISRESNRLDILEKESIDKIDEIFKTYDSHIKYGSYSGGKDSDMIYHLLVNKMGKVSLKWIMANTSNDTAETFKKVKAIPNIQIISPKVGFYQWIKDVKNYYTPTRLVRNCCSTFKEGQIAKAFSKDDEILMITGVRKYESAKRKAYQFVMDDDFNKELFGKNNWSPKWVTFAPIVNWTDVDVWLYIIREGIQYNKQYDYGYNRCGCLICPYQHDYIDLLTQEHYPNQWNRWKRVLEKNYSIYQIKNSLHWTLKEWQDGKWKLGGSKEGELIRLKGTPERIQQVADIKGVTYEIAEKYFKKKCHVCGKSIGNPDIISMNLKMIGREMDLDKLMCKKHLCEFLEINQKQYTEKVVQFRNSECDLF